MLKCYIKDYVIDTSVGVGYCSKCVMNNYNGAFD